MNNKKTLRLLLSVLLTVVMIVPLLSIPMSMTASAAVPTAEEILKTTTYVSTDFEDQAVGSKLTTGDAIKTVPNVAPIQTEEGHGKFVRIPYVGATSYANDSNWDKSLIVKNPASSWKDGYLTISADFRPHYDSTVGGDPTIEMQLSSISYTKADGTAGSLNWISFGYIHLKTGAIGDTLGGTRTSAANMTLDAWNSVQIVLDLSTGTYNLVVNGEIYAYGCHISNSQDDASVRYATLTAGTLILAKVNKVTAAYQTDTSAENYSYIDVDNVAFRTATAAEKALYTTTVTDGQTNLKVGHTYKTQDGDKIRIPFIGTATAGSGANGSGNYDKASSLNHPVISSAAGSVVFEAKYYPHYVELSKDSSAANYCGYDYSGSAMNPTVEIQAHGKWMKADGTTGNTNFLSFGAIDVKSGAFNNNARGGTTVSGAAGFVNDQWNTLKIVIELSTGTFDIYINGHLYAYNCPISNATTQLGYYMSLNANSFIFAKTNKNTGAYLAPELAESRDYSYVDIDDISLRPLTQEENSYMLNFETDEEKAYGTALTYNSQEITYNGTSYGTWRVPTKGASLGNPAGFDNISTATTYSVTTIAGEKCLKIPFEGFCIMSSGAPYNVGGNADARIYSSTPGYSWSTTPNLVFEVDYYLSASINPFGVIVQFTNMTYLTTGGVPTTVNEATIFAVNAKTGDVYCLGGGVKTGAANLVANSWNKIKAAIDMTTGTYNVYVNGNLYATECRFNSNSNSAGYVGTNFAARAESLAIFKGGKVQGNASNKAGGTPASENGYWENSSQYVAMDNLQIYMPTETTVTVNGVVNNATVGNVFSLNKTGYTFVSAVVTDSTGTRTIYDDYFTVVGETTVTATYLAGVTYVEKNFEGNALYAKESGNAADLPQSITLQENGNKFLRVPFVGAAAYANDSNWDKALKVKNNKVPAGELIEITGKFRPHRSSSYGNNSFQVQVNGATYKDNSGNTQTKAWLSIFELKLNEGGVNVESENANIAYAEGQSGLLAYDQWYTITAQLDAGQNRINIFVNGVLYKTGTLKEVYNELGLNANSLIIAKCNKIAAGYAPASTDLKTGDYSYVDIDDVRIVMPTKIDIVVDGRTEKVYNNSTYVIAKEGYTFVSAVVTDDNGTRTVYNDTILINGETTVTATWRIGEYFLVEGFEDSTVGQKRTTDPADPNVNKILSEDGNKFMRIPFVGSEGYASDSNWDRSLQLTHKAAPNGDRIFLAGKYRPHYSDSYSSTTVQAQIGSYTFYEGSTARGGQFLSLFFINLKTGALSHESGTCEYTGAPGLVADEWNDIAVLIDTSTVTVEVYVNGLLYMVNNPNCQYYDSGKWVQVPGATNFSIGASSLILAKCNKIEGAYAPAGTDMQTGDCSYIDVDDFELTKETDNIMVTATVNGEDTRILPGTSILISSTATQFLTGATVNSGDAVYYPEYKQVVVNGACDITVSFSKTGFAENFEGQTTGAAYTGSQGVGNGPSSAVIRELNGNKYVHVNFAPGASNDAANGDENVDRNLTVNSPAITYQDGASRVILSAKYFIDANSKGSVQSQYQNLSGYDAEQNTRVSKSWYSLFVINAEDGQMGREFASGKKVVKIGEWNTITTVIDLATGDVSVFVNGALALEDNIGLTNITLTGNRWIIGKVNKTSGALAGGFAIDDITEMFGGETVTYTLNGVATESTTGTIVEFSNSDDILSASVTFEGVTRTTATTKFLAINGLVVNSTYFDAEDVAIEMIPGAAVRFSNPTGLRYSAILDPASVALLQGYLDAGLIQSVKLGVLIAPTSYVQNAEAFTKAAMEDGKYVDIAVDFGDWLDETGKFAGALVGIKADHLNKSYSGIAYVLVTLLSGKEVPIYADYDPASGARTVADVAQAAIDANDFNNTTEQVILQSFLPSNKDLSGYLTSSTAVSELHATNTAIYFKLNGVYVRLTYVGNYGFRIQANVSGWNGFNDTGAAQALAFAAGDDLDQGTSQSLERIWIDSGDATCIRIRGGNADKDVDYANRPYIKLDSNGSGFSMAISNGDNNKIAQSTGAKGTNIGGISNISYSGGKFTISGGLNATEGIYGGGEHLQALNKRGKTVTLYTSDGYADVNRTYCAVPLFTTTRGMGIFINRYERINFTSTASGSNGSWTITLDNDLLDCYIFASGVMQDSISAYADLTGHADMPDEWNNGTLICRYGPDYGILRGTSSGAKDTYTYLGDGIVDIVIRFIEAGAKMNAVIFEGMSANNYLRANTTDTSVIADRDANGNLQYNTNYTTNVNGKAVKYDLKVKTVTAKGSRVQMWRDIIEYLHSLDIRCMVYTTPGNPGIGSLPTNDYLVHVNVYENGTLIQENTVNVPKVTISGSSSLSATDSQYVFQGSTSENPNGPSMKYIDITNDEAMEWYFNTVWKQYIDLGIDGVKIDFCEEMPDTGITYKSGSNNYTVTYNWADPSKLYTPDAGSEHHGYPSLVNTMFYKFADSYANTVEGQDGFVILARGGGIGSQRNPYMWAGDQKRETSVWSRQLLSVLNYGISGVPFTTYDMGGYQYSVSSVTTSSRPTLNYDAGTTYYKRTATSSMTVAVESQIFSRSVEYTAFTNTIQTHGYVRHWYELDAEAQTIYKNYVALHNSPEMRALLEYYQAKAVETGVPVVRALVLNYQNDASVYNIEDQFMLGDAFLVCPVLSQGSTSRSVYLPAGNWGNMNSTSLATVSGGRSISPSVYYNKIAVYLNKDLETTDPEAYALALAVYNSSAWQTILGASNQSSWSTGTNSSWAKVASGLHTYN